MTTYLYHICRKEDVGNLRQGYIGVSKRPKRRWEEHRMNPNGHVKNAMAKYDDITYSIIAEGLEDEMLRMETWLRPSKQIGWNIAEGGGMPPSQRGKVSSEETRRKVGDAQTGKKHHGWLGYVRTPVGIFVTSKEASDALGISADAIMKRCKKPRWTEWSCISKDLVIQTFDIGVLGGHVEYNYNDEEHRLDKLIGEACTHSILSESQVIEIKTKLIEYEKGLHGALANKYSVSKSTIRNIASGRTWSHIGVL